MYFAYTPQRVLGLVRISDADDLPEGATPEEMVSAGILRQKEDVCAECDRLGWPHPTHWLVEDDVSAYKRKRFLLPDGSYGLRTDRPELRQALLDLAADRYDGLIAYDLDRAFRDMRDLEDAIDIAEARTPRLAVTAVTGSLRLNNDADITMARVMVAVANKASRDTGRRVSRAFAQLAREGKFKGGTRPYGFEPDGITPRDDECKVIADSTVRVIAGRGFQREHGEANPYSLRSICRDLRDAEIPTATGRAWTPEHLKPILLRPRNAGIMVHQGEEVGPAPWKPIVPVEQFRAVVAILTDPSRNTGPGPAPKWLGSGLYVCGLCGGPMQVHAGTGRYPRYTCKRSGHLVRTAQTLDEYVSSVIVERLSRQDVHELLAAPADGVDLPAFRAEAASLRVQLDEFAADRAEGLITRAQMLTGTQRVRERLDEIERQMAEAVGPSPLAPLATAEDAEQAWARLSLGDRRAVLRTLVRVVVLPAARGKGFNPRHVLIAPADTLALAA